MFEQTVSVPDTGSLLSLFGARDQHLRKIRDALAVSISSRDHEIHIAGQREAVARAAEVIEQLKSYVERFGTPSAEEVDRALTSVRHGAAPEDAPTIEVFNASRQVRPRTAGQIRYVQTIREHELTLAEGPAGTGKTYLAVATAVSALRHEQIRKIVLVRPAVEAGESLGFLPGDLHAKINPYLRPLLDSLSEMVDYDQLKRYMDSDVIEVVPLAYMRGRTLNEAFVILDEAQNTTISQMKMFLTRMGRGSKIVVSGDTTQVDLPSHTTSGLTDALHRLKGIEGIGRVQLTGADIVRHRLVQEILKAYDQEQKKPR